MSGLQKILKSHGEMHITDATGKKTVWLWDYANDKPRIKSEMTGEEIAASERAKWGGGMETDPVEEKAKEISQSKTTTQ